MFGRMTPAPVAHQHVLEKPSRIRLIPALTVIVFLRRRVGERMLNMLWLLPMAAALYLIQPLTGRALDDHALRIFAVACAVLGIAHRVQVERMKRGMLAPWHSYSRGESWLSFLPLPATFIHMVLDPALCALLGWLVVQHVSVWLGYWLLVAALMLFFTEFHDYRNQYHRNADLRDGLVEGQIQGDAILGTTGDGRPMSGPDPVIRRPGRKT
jgi:hypothetical protein